MILARRLSDERLCDVVAQRAGGQWLGSDIVELVNRFVKNRALADRRLVEIHKLQSCILRKNAEIANLRLRNAGADPLD